jgi:hypothetical protein
MQDIPLACNMSVFTPAQRTQHEQNTQALFAQVQQVEEIECGYSFHFKADQWMQAAAFADLERLCCPFFTFELTLSPAGVCSLRLIGPDGVKELIRAELPMRPA